MRPILGTFSLACALRISCNESQGAEFKKITEDFMKRKKEIMTAAILSGIVGLGAPSLFAQTAPGGVPSGSATPGQTAPTVPQPGPTFPQPGLTVPQQPQPNIPGQPAPGLPQSKPIPGQPTPGLPQTEPIPGQAAPLPGQPGTIPERLEQPTTPNRLDVPGTSTEKPAPGTGAKLEGERRSIIPPAPRTATPIPGEADTTSAPSSSGR
jgi:hypothetical protein